MKINKYPDGTSYIEWDKADINTVFRINSYEDLWHLNQYLDTLKHNNLSMIDITIPCLLDAQADRRFSRKQSFGLKLVCNLLNQYPNKFKIFHPHNQEVVEALMDNVEIIDNRLFIQEVLNTIAGKEKDFDFNYLNNLILMSSDAGGFKPLMKLCDKIDWTGATASCSKHRRHTGEKSIIVQKCDREDYKGADILIIDDICVYGGTFKGLAKLLRERNCGKLYLAVSHMTVQNLGEDPVTNYFDKVFTTNSKFEKYTFKNNDKNHGIIPTTFPPKNLEIIKLF